MRRARNVDVRRHGRRAGRAQRGAAARAQGPNIVVVGRGTEACPTQYLRFEVQLTGREVGANLDDVGQATSDDARDNGIPDAVWLLPVTGFMPAAGCDARRDSKPSERRALPDSRRGARVAINAAAGIDCRRRGSARPNGMRSRTRCERASSRSRPLGAIASARRKTVGLHGCVGKRTSRRAWQSEIAPGGARDGDLRRSLGSRATARPRRNLRDALDRRGAEHFAVLVVQRDELAGSNGALRTAEA